MSHEPRENRLHRSSIATMFALWLMALASMGLTSYFADDWIQSGTQNPVEQQLVGAWMQPLPPGAAKNVILQKWVFHSNGHIEWSFENFDSGFVTTTSGTWKCVGNDLVIDPACREDDGIGFMKPAGPGHPSKTAARLRIGRLDEQAVTISGLPYGTYELFRVPN